MISLLGMVIKKLAHKTSHKVISYKGSILSYNESKIDIWNINANINVGNDDKVCVK